MNKILIGGFILALSVGSVSASAEPLRGGNAQGVSYGDKAERGKDGPQHKKFLTSRHEERGRHGHRDRDGYRDDRGHREHRSHRGRDHDRGHGWKHKKHAWKHKKHQHRHQGYRGHKHHWKKHGHHRYHDHDRHFRYHLSYNSGPYSLAPGGYLSIDLAR